MSEEKKIKKIEFAPGCFDHFDGTQEELDSLMAEITDMFTNMTPEELKAQSRVLTEEDFEGLSDEEKAMLMAAITDEPENRKLQ